MDEWRAGWKKRLMNEWKSEGGRVKGGMVVSWRVGRWMDRWVIRWMVVSESVEGPGREEEMDECMDRCLNE